MFENLVSGFRRSVLEPRINAKMEEVGQAMVAEATRLAPVDTGHLKSAIGYTYNTQTKTITLHCDASYALFQELGTRHIPAHPFLRPAMNVVPRIWKGGLGTALTGHSVAVSAPNVATRYHDRIQKFTKGRIGGARLKLGHGRFT